MKTDIQRKPIQRAEVSNHPAEAIAINVLDSCCHVLVALRQPVTVAELEQSTPDETFHARVAELLSIPPSSDNLKRNSIQYRRENGFVLWDDLERRFHGYHKPLAAEEKLERIRTLARDTPMKVLEYVKMMDDPNQGEWPHYETLGLVDAASPFGVARVCGWLRQMNLLEVNDEVGYSKPECFDPQNAKPFLGISSGTIAKIMEWLGSDNSPPAKLLPFRLVRNDGTNVSIRHILLAQGTPGSVKNVALRRQRMTIFGIFEVTSPCRAWP